MHSRGKTLVFPQLRQFLVLPLCCLMNFCRMKKFQLILLTNISQRLQMFLLFLCLGKILAPAAQRVASRAPFRCPCLGPSWSHPSSRSMTAPTPFCAVAPRSFTIRVGSRDEVIAVSCLKACTAADAKPGSPCRSSRLLGSRPGGLAATKGLVFRPAAFYTFFSGTATRRYRNCFPTW